jgi:anti-sigma regulatory factor (Ser/Thr protein kinase)
MIYSEAMPTDHVLRFAGTTAALADAVTELRAILDARMLHPRHRHDVELVFEEVASNIVNYGKPSGAIEALLRFGTETTLAFEDDGVPFDPRRQPPPPAASEPADLRIGGLGLVIVRDLCSGFDYVRTAEQRNRLTLAIPVPAEDEDPTGEMPVVSEPRS